MRVPSIIVHGGAGTVPVDVRSACLRGCRLAAEAGYDALAQGATALDAAQLAVRMLEADPTYNAGRGGNLDEDGHPFHDAAVMRGRDLALGAVGAVLGLVHPVDAARAVLEDGRHCLLVGEGALRLAREHGLALQGPSEAITERARRRLERARQTGEWDRPDAGEVPRVRNGGDRPGRDRSGQTVGAVTRDLGGGLAAATSTGGLVHRRAGRVGDTPLAGAGTYADDDLGAVSATGDGEWMIRSVMAYRAVMALSEAGEAASLVLRRLLETSARRCPGYSGGLIGLTPDGRPGWARTTPHMGVAWRLGNSGGQHI